MSEKFVPFIEKQPHVALAQGIVVHGIGGLETSQVSTSAASTK